MREVTVSQFTSDMTNSVNQVIFEHETLKVIQGSGRDFVVISAEDWEQMQETLYVLQNQSLMQQIAGSLKTHLAGTGYTPTQEEVNEIVSV